MASAVCTRATGPAVLVEAAAARGPVCPPPKTTSFVPFTGLRSGSSLKAAAAGKRLEGRKLPAGVARAATTVAPKFTTLKPLADRILVKIETPEEKTSGGILLPSAAQSKPQSGSVVAVGDGRRVGEKKIPVSIENGAKIVYSKYAGTEVEFNGENHLLLKEDDAIGLLSTDNIEDLKPLNDRVLLKVLEADNKTSGGVLLTESAKEKPVIGTVVAVGPGSIGEDGERKALDVSPDNTVLYSKFAGNDFKGNDGTQYVLLRANDIMAILS